MPAHKLRRLPNNPGHLVHQVAGDYREAGEVALSAGIDIELPDALCFGPQLAGSVESGSLPEATVDRAVRRVLRQKAELGLLDHDWTPPTAEPNIDLDSPENRRLARRLAERSVILLANTGLLPLSASDLAGRTVALIGPCANDPLTFMGCYSYPNHVLDDYPELGMGIQSPSLFDALKAQWPDTHIDFHQGVPISEPNPTGITDAVASARAADVCIVAVGDRAGMFGRGTSGEGCDVPDLNLPGIQSQLLREVLDVGTPTVLVVVSGRPYALGHAGAARAMVQAFMPGEEGGGAIARVLAGEVNPSGKLPVQIPRISGGQPGTYLQPQLGTFSKGISNLDPTPLFSFGHGLSYTNFAYGPLSVDLPEIAPDGSVRVSVEVSNIGDRAGDEIVQLYLHDLQATTARPLKQLIGFQRLSLTPAQSATVTFEVHADLFAYTNHDFRRVVNQGRSNCSRVGHPPSSRRGPSSKSPAVCARSAMTDDCAPAWSCPAACERSSCRRVMTPPRSFVANVAPSWRGPWATLAVGREPDDRPPLPEDTPRLLLRLSRGQPAEHERPEDDGAVEEPDPLGRDATQRQDVLHQVEQQDAGERTEHGSASTVEADAADDGCREHSEDPPVAQAAATEVSRPASRMPASAASGRR